MLISTFQVFPAFRRPYWSALQSLVRGNARHDARAALPADAPLSPAQQAAALINQATDPNLLGRAYAGWAPFM